MLRLPAFVRVPREVRFAQSLPKTGSGKIDRKNVAAHFNELGLASSAR